MENLIVVVRLNGSNRQIMKLFSRPAVPLVDGDLDFVHPSVRVLEIRNPEGSGYVVFTSPVLEQWFRAIYAQGGWETYKSS